MKTLTLHEKVNTSRYNVSTLR